ncbi:MAG TPA: S8 family serine peptidase [Gaiellaceae bacterium]|nr:S8 family serine peptidase [Gaiellaceae bacterium]
MPAVVSVAVAVALAGSSAASQAASPVAEVSPRLEALVSGGATPDERLGRLVPAYRQGELAYFVVLGERKTPDHRIALEQAGARILREYRELDAFAVASRPGAVGRIAALPGVTDLVPVDVIETEAETEVDQSRATTADVGAPALWNQGITGTGIRIAVLDTGLDATHPDLDDRDFRNWSSLLNPPKVVDARSFLGGACVPIAGATDGHGHGTHVAGIATGTGEGTPVATDNGRYAGIAPGAELAVGKVLTDAGAGLNSDLLAAMEWAATPAGLSSCSIGAHVVNLSLGSESRPVRLNTGSDIDLVSLMLNRLAVRYGTVFVAAAGNSGPFIGSVLETPGAAAQALSVAASAKDYDLNHDDTLSGDTCAGYRHSPSPTNDCSAGVGTQPPSLGSFSSRGPAGDLWLRPDLSAPGYNIVSAQAASGAALAQNDLNRGTRGDPLYATATGTSMAAPATSGSVALLLQAYRDRHGSLPAGSSGLAGLNAPAHALVRAALMNTAGSGQHEARWILSTDLNTVLDCPPELDPLLVDFCSLAAQIGAILGNQTLYEVRNRAADPYVGALGEGAGKLNVGRALAALRDGVVVYSTASGSGVDAGTGPRDLQGSWQIGATTAGASVTQSFVVHVAPGAPRAQVRFSFVPGNPSDGSKAIAVGKNAWSIALPGTTNVSSGGDAVVKFTAKVPTNAAPGHYTGTVVASASNGQVLRIPVFASVALHDANVAVGVGGGQAAVVSPADVFAKSDTIWPSGAGAAGTGAGSDWLVYAVELGSGLREARFRVNDAAAGDETYDLYVYGPDYNLRASTHPFASEGVTDVQANNARGPSTPASPQTLTLQNPAAGRYFVAVSRAKVGLLPGTGDFGAFVLTLDEVS